MTVYIEKPNKNFSSDSYTDARSADICKYFSQEILKPFPMDCWVAGGSIVSMFLGQDIHDIDIFFPGENQIFEAKSYLEAFGGRVIYESEFSLKIELTSQHNNDPYRMAPPKKQVLDLVKVMHKGPKQTIEAFDMFCCMVAINKEGWLYYDSNFFCDLNNRVIRLNKNCKVISDEPRILQRLTKYGKKGFELQLSEALNWVKFLKRSREEAEKNKLNKDSLLSKKMAEGYIPYSIG